jgi:CBS domain-containing protein
VHDVAEFLRRHPPFDTLTEDALAGVAATVEIEYHPAGTLVLAPGCPAPPVAYVVRTGEVELVAQDRVVDCLGAGEVLALGSVLTGAPLEHGVRAADDVLLYRIPAEVVISVLTRPAGLRFVAQSVAPASTLMAVAERTVGLLARPIAVCAPTDTVAEAARRMEHLASSAALVRPTQRSAAADSRESWGILTDVDLRSRVLAAGRTNQTPVAQVVTPGVVTVPDDTAASQAQLIMLERGVQHLPVVDAAGDVVGMVEQVDLIEAHSSETFHVRRLIAGAPDVSVLADLAPRIARWTCDAVDAGVLVRQVLATRAVLVEALLRRLVDIQAGAWDGPPQHVTWFVLGGLGRREHFPGSDIDTAVAWQDGDDETQVLRLAGAVLAGASACGLRADANGVNADDVRFARPSRRWHADVAGWVGDPLHADALTYLSALADARAVAPAGSDGGCVEVPRDVRLLRVLAREAVRHRPPTGFVRGFVVEHSGEHRGQLDLKRSCLRSVVGLARWAGLAAGSPARATVDRLRAGAAAGVLDDEDAQALEEIADLVMGLRLRNHVEAMQCDKPLSDHLDPKTLSPLTRRHLREAFRLLGHVQTRVENDLDLHVP